MMTQAGVIDELRDYQCPLAVVQQVICGKYKLRIVWDLRNGPLRFGELRKSLVWGLPPGTDVTPRVLSRELKALARVGWIERMEYAVVPPKVEYRLTEVGQGLVPVIAQLLQWGVQAHCHIRRGQSAAG